MKKHSRQFMNFTPFDELPPRKRRDAYIKLRSKIKCNQHGETFKGWSEFIEPGRPLLYNQDVQVQFLGLDGRTIWNAYVFTATRQYWWAIGEIASNKAWELRPEPRTKIRDSLIPEYDSSGRLKYYSMKEDPPYPEFGDRTRFDWKQDYESQLIKNDMGDTAPIFEEFRIEPGFEYGTGLYVTLDVPSLTNAVIETMIARWQTLGEKPWKSDTPVPHANLPKDTFHNLATEQKLNEWSPNNS
jgi:hypothetical protein